MSTAYCGAQQTSGFSGAIIDSYEPEPSGGKLGPANAPPLSNADHFSCSGGVYDVYQYAQSQNIGDTGFDEDVFAADTPGLLNSTTTPTTTSAPSIAFAPSGGNPFVAFHASGSNLLWSWTGALNTAGNGTPTYDGMAAGTSPSLALLPNGYPVVAFQANGGKLWTWTGALNTAGNGTPTYDGMAAGTSPSLALPPTGGNPVVASTPTAATCCGPGPAPSTPPATAPPPTLGWPLVPAPLSRCCPTATRSSRSTPTAAICFGPGPAR